MRLGWETVPQALGLAHGVHTPRYNTMMPKGSSQMRPPLLLCCRHVPGGAGRLQLALDSGQHKGGFPGTTVSTEAWGAPVSSLCSRLPAGRAPPWPGLWPEGKSHRTQAGQVCPSWPLGRSTGQGQSGPSVPPVASEKGCASSAVSLAGGVCCRGPALWATLSEPPLCCSPHCRACGTLLQMPLPVLA